MMTTDPSVVGVAAVVVVVFAAHRKPVSDDRLLDRPWCIHPTHLEPDRNRLCCLRHKPREPIHKGSWYDKEMHRHFASLTPQDAGVADVAAHRWLRSLF